MLQIRKSVKEECHEGTSKKSINKERERWSSKAPGGFAGAEDNVNTTIEKSAPVEESSESSDCLVGKERDSVKGEVRRHLTILLGMKGRVNVQTYLTVLLRRQSVKRVS